MASDVDLEPAPGKNYLEEVAARIRRHVPASALPEDNTDQLFAIYAVLALALGERVSEADVHNAWVAWMLGKEQEHPSFEPYSALDDQTARQDVPFAEAIRQAARELPGPSASLPGGHAGDPFLSALLPAGEPRSSHGKSEFLELYKLMVSSSEALVARRSAVNTFFLTLNGLLVTGIGLFIRDLAHLRVEAFGVLLLTVTGMVLCGAWRSLLTSFGQLNAGKFAVIGAMEQRLAAAIYNAEWNALKEGKDKRVYQSFTKRESVVPTLLLLGYFIFALLALLIGFSVLHV